VGRRGGAEEITKSVGDRLKVYVHYGDNARKEYDKDLTPFLHHDVVLTTYQQLGHEAKWPARERAVLRMHWWRLVLDESQRVPKPANARSAMSEIAKSCADLSRTHSWCMSGTPVGSAAVQQTVDNLLGQLIILGVEPYCNLGDNGDAFWEREISARWKARDPEALEVVHDLLGQIMMRHSKEQTMADGADGERAKIVTLPEKTESTMLLPLADPSERAVYGELERFCAEELLAAEAAKAAVAAAVAEGKLPSTCVHYQNDQDAHCACDTIANLRKAAQRYRSEHRLKPKELQHAATHVSSLLYPPQGGTGDAGEGLEAKLAARAARPPPAAAAPSPAAGLLGPALLRDAAAAATGSVASRLRQLLANRDAQCCGLCKGRFGGAPAGSDAGPSSAGAAGPSSDGAAAGHEVRGKLVPRLTPCGHLFCSSCLGATAGDDTCPECQAPDSGLRSATLLATPLDAASLAETDAPPVPPLPVIATASWATATPPPAEKLSALRVWRCPGAPCHDDNVSYAAQAAADAAKKAAAAAAKARGASRLEANAAGQDAQDAQLAAARAASKEKRERQVQLELDGMHFCSQLCAEAKFKRGDAHPRARTPSKPAGPPAPSPPLSRFGRPPCAQRSCRTAAPALPRSSRDCRPCSRRSATAASRPTRRAPWATTGRVACRASTTPARARPSRRSRPPSRPPRRRPPPRGRASPSTRPAWPPRCRLPPPPLPPPPPPPPPPRVLPSAALAPRRRPPPPPTPSPTRRREGSRSGCPTSASSRRARPRARSSRTSMRRARRAPTGCTGPAARAPRWTRRSPRSSACARRARR
jgi:hypothetical protein